eukprot:jgi/Ulvmu1/5781/UM025_0035.1
MHAQVASQIPLLSPATIIVMGNIVSCQCPTSGHVLASQALQDPNYSFVQGGRGVYERLREWAEAQEAVSTVTVHEYPVHNLANVVTIFHRYVIIETEHITMRIDYYKNGVRLEAYGQPGQPRTDTEIREHRELLTNTSLRAGGKAHGRELSRKEFRGDATLHRVADFVNNAQHTCFDDIHWNCHHYAGHIEGSF